MTRKIFALVLALLVCTALATTAFAADARSPYELPYDVETGRLLECVDSSMLSNGVSRAYLGYGEIHGEDPIFGNPRAYAYTKTYEVCYVVRAKCDVNNDGQSTSTSGWKEMNNTDACNSGTVTATTPKCTFTGYHEGRKTASSGLYTTTSTKSYG